MRVGEAVIRLLETYGVDTVFGIPGVNTIELYRGLAGSPIRPITARNEQGAGFMADAYARVTGRPGVCVLISGPGVTNAATPIAEAYHDSIPMLVVAAAGARADLGRGNGSLHDLPDQAGLVRSITALSWTVLDAAELPGLLADAWRIFDTRRPRPVHIAIPTDLLAEDSPPLVPVARAGARARPGRTAIRRAAELLAGARRPAIILGGGAVDAGAEARALAELIDAPVAVTGNGRGVMPSVHPLCLNSTLPMEPVQELFATSDVVLLVGTELSPIDTVYTGVPLTFRGSIIRVDLDLGQLHKTVVPKVAVLADAAAALAALEEAVRSIGRPRVAEPGAERVRRALAEIRWTDQTETHRPWLDALDAALPEDRIVAADSTQLAYSAHQYMPACRPRSWFAPYGFGTLGTALPQAIGAKVAAPGRPVVAIAGDGGFLFTVGELATARDLGAPLPIVLWDNRGYGEIRYWFDRAGAPRIGTETTAHDFLTIARGFGCLAVEATTPDDLRLQVERALEADRPTVIRVLEPGF